MSQNDVKSAFFWHVVCHISAIFEDIDLKFCTHMHQPLRSNIVSVFLNFDIDGEIFDKEKRMLKILKNLRNFSNFFKIRDSSFVAPLILRRFI